MNENVVIVDAVRSAVGRATKGTLALTRPDELAGQVVAGLLGRARALGGADSLQHRGGRVSQPGRRIPCCAPGRGRSRPNGRGRIRR